MPTCVLSPGHSWLQTPPHHPATAANGSLARLAPGFTPTQHSHLSRVPLPPAFNPHRPASAANASGFLLTALSDARDNTHSHAFCPECASDKALTYSGPIDLPQRKLIRSSCLFHAAPLADAIMQIPAIRIEFPATAHAAERRPAPRHSPVRSPQAFAVRTIAAMNIGQPRTSPSEPNLRAPVP